MFEDDLASVCTLGSLRSDRPRRWESLREKSENCCQDLAGV